MQIYDLASLTVHVLFRRDDGFSYNASDEKTTSNGYGTLAQAGWSKQKPINGVFKQPDDAIAMAEFDSQIVLLFQPDGEREIQMCVGQYISE